MWVSLGFSDIKWSGFAKSHSGLTLVIGTVVACYSIYMQNAMHMHLYATIVCYKGVVIIIMLFRYSMFYSAL